MKRPLFTSAYDLLPYGVFTFFVLCFALHPLSPFYTHHLYDPDDYMRLHQVVSWLQGQGWHDLSVPRMSPGADTVIHWSRLIDMPLALFALPFISFFGVSHAVFISSLLVPLMGLVLLFALLCAHAKMFIGNDRARLVCVMVLFAPLLLTCFSPGRADHHATQLLIAEFGLFSLTRIIFDEKKELFAALAGLAFACGFWIGAEILPWAALYILCLALISIKRPSAAKSAAIFGVCLFVFTAAFVFIALPSTEYSSRALSWFSPAYAIFAFLSGAIFVVGWSIGCVVNNGAARFSLYALLGITALGVLPTFVPDVLHGPFANYNPFDATTTLENIVEAQPLAHNLHFSRFSQATALPLFLIFFRLLFLPLMALFVCLYMAKHKHAEHRIAWLVQGAFLLVALAMSLFWQLRVARFLELFALVPLTYLLIAWWDKLKWGLWDRPLFWAEIGVFLLLGPLPVVLLPTIVRHAPLYPDLVLFPADRKPPVCSLNTIIPFLNDADRLGSTPLTIMNEGDTGPQLLFSTHHRVVAGNFNVEGNKSAFDFFSSKNDAIAKTEAKRWKADLVLVCHKATPTLYLGKNYYSFDKMEFLPGKDGLLRFTNTDPSQPLIQRLIRGQNPPWLKPIEIFGPSDYLLFRIVY
ncbi:MAG: hypothetical protein WC464_03910 [Bdellovibrionales bacterium]